MRTAPRPAALLMLVLTACHAWRSAGVEPQALGPNEKLRIELSSGERIELEHPIVTADSLAGTRHGSRVAVARTEVRHVAVLRVSPLKTAALVFWLVAVTVAATAATSEGWDFSGWDFGD